MTGSPLAVRGFEELWAKSTGRAPPGPLTLADRVMLSVAGLGIHEVLSHLHQDRPELAEFAAWVLDRAGPPDPVQVVRYHAWLDGAAMPAEAQERLAAIDACPDALDAADQAQWEEHGFVILRAAIDANQAAAAAEALWHHVGAQPDDPASWYNPATGALWVPLYHAPELEAARRSPRVRKAFAQLWGTADLWLTIDQTSFNAPQREGRGTRGFPLHWDTSLTPPIPFGTQAILYLTDTAANQGALRLVPGFHRGMEPWLAALGDADPREVDLNAEAITVPAQAGDLIIWHHALPHNASPNRADKPRLAQYLNMFAAHEDLREWR